MDNFRKHNAKSGRSHAMEGFLSAPKQSQHKPVASSPAAPQPAARQIGNFRSTDGFHPAVQGQVITSGRPVVTGLPARQPNRDASGNITLQLDETPRKKHHKFGRKRNWKRIALKSFVALLIIGIIGGGYITGKAYIKARQVFKGGGNAAALEENVDPAKLNGEGDGRVNILMLGKGGPGHTAPDLTDTLLIASIDPIQNEAALVSVPRDLYVKAGSGHTKINAVYANAKYAVLNEKKTADQDKRAEAAGLDAISKTIEAHMGIPIHYYVMVDFEGFKKAIDEVGGVDINVKDPLQETMNINGRMYNLNVRAGVEHFDGFRALAYSRSRMVSPRGDFDRTERQRLVLLALKDKVLSAGTFANPKKISGLIDAFGNNVQSNLSVQEIMRLYDIGKSIDASKVVSIGLADPPNVYVRTDNINGLSVVVPRAGLDDYTEIKNFLRNTLKDSFIKNENASIAVYNGTTVSGLAGQRANDLRSYGYTITTVADAPTKTYTKTVLVDLRNGAKKYTKSYLEKRLGVTSVNSMPDNSISPGTADFVIILGSN